MKKILLLLFVLISLAIHCSATELEVMEKQLEIIDAYELENSLPESARDIKLSADISFNQGIRVVWEKLSENVKGIFSSGIRCVTTIVAISMLCNAVGAMSVPADGRSVQTTLSLVGALSVTAAASGRITSVIGMGKDLIFATDTFSKAFLPVAAAAEAASGLPGAAVAKASVAMLFSDVLITVINRFLVPLMYLNIFAATANAASPNESLRRICDLSVNTISIILKFALGAFVSYITVAGIVASGNDSLGVKTAQLAAGTVPVVGSIISQAAETVVAGAVMMKNCIGIFGILSIISICAVPFATLSINYILFKIAAVCASPIIGGSISELTERLGKSFGLMLAMSASSVTVLFISIIAAMRGLGVI